ncbi:putative transcription factor interactor and regulator AUX-IAA family [Dioscorea sansibarensis]
MNIRATLMETTTATTTTAAATTTTTTVAGKEDQEGGELGQEEGIKKGLSLGLQNNLELRLGISMNNNNEFKEMDRSSTRRSFITSQEGLVLQRSSGHEVGTGGGGGGGGSKRSWLSETAAACGFVHPWSLAARQEKAALEQAHHKASIPSTSSLPRVAQSAQAQPVVGWPPVRTFRRNLAGSSQATKQEMESEKESKKAKSLMEMEKVANNINHVQSNKPTMFVKVNMEGYAVGRKIDLKAHDSYDSLSKSLQKMFQNFLSVNIQGIVTKENERVDAVKNNYILLYEDNEGDRMLVGDVPWEMFITSVKRLHIALDPRAMNDGEGMAEEQERN